MYKELILFTSENCMPCKSFKPLVEAAANKRGIRMKCIVFHPSNASEFTKYNVRTVPTLVCVGNDDKEVGTQLSGAVTAGRLEQKFASWGI